MFIVIKLGSSVGTDTKDTRSTDSSIRIAEKALLSMNEYTNSLSEYTNALKSRSNKNKLNDFASRRNFTIDTINKSEIFYIGSQTEMMLPQYFDRLEEFGIISNVNKKPIYQDRYVIPIKNSDGKVQGFVGYNGDAAERYVYATPKYYRRADTLWGLENIEIAYDMGYAIVTEGITDAMRLRQQGHPNTFARCGTRPSDVVDSMLNRCSNGVISIPDRDSAGYKASKRWNLNRQIILKVFIGYKDADEMCRESDSNVEWFESYLNSCIHLIKDKEHNGFNCGTTEVTIQ